MGTWKLVKPADGRNYIKNPSFERGTADWYQDSTTITQILGDARTGSCCLEVTPSDGHGTYTITTLDLVQNSWYAWQMWVKVPVGTSVQIYVAGSSGSYRTYAGTGSWQRIGRVWKHTESAANNVWFNIKHTSGTVADFYLDGVALEAIADPPSANQDAIITTYLDGDQPGCYWDGAEHDSEAVRPIASRQGGYIKDLASDYSFPVTWMIGAGVPQVINVLRDYVQRPGSVFIRSRVGHRLLRLMSTVQATTLAGLHQLRQALVLTVAPNSSPNTLIYTGADDDRYLTGYYDGGLELDNLTGFSERDIALRFVATDPMFYGDHDIAQALDVEDDSYLYGFIDWRHNIVENPNLTAIATDIVEKILFVPPKPSPFTLGGVAGRLFVFGFFENWDGDADADYAAMLELGGAFGALTWGPAWSTNTNNGIYDALFLGDKIYVVGLFTDAGGIGAADWVASYSYPPTGWAAVGTPNGGSTSFGSMQAIEKFDEAGTKIILGGSFSNLYDQASFDNLAVVSTAGTPDTSHWTTGPNSGVTTAKRLRDGRIAIGGAFTTVDSVTAVGAAVYDGSDWAPLVGNGGFTGGVVNKIEQDAKTGDIWVAGAFTTVGGAACRGICRVTEAGRVDLLGSQLTASGTDVFSVAIDPTTGTVYISGRFATGGPLSPIGQAYWNGTSWQHIPIRNITGSSLFYGYDILALPAGAGYFPKGTIFWSADASASFGSRPGKTTVNNPGTAPAYPVIRVQVDDSGSGGRTVYWLYNATTDKLVQFDYQLADGDYFEIDFRPGQRAAQNLADDAHWPVVEGSDFGEFYLAPGDNDIYLWIDISDDAGTYTAQIYFRPAYLGVD